MPRSEPGRGKLLGVAVGVVAAALMGCDGEAAPSRPAAAVARASPAAAPAPGRASPGAPAAALDGGGGRRAAEPDLGLADAGPRREAEPGSDRDAPSTLHADEAARDGGDADGGHPSDDDREALASRTDGEPAAVEQDGPGEQLLASMARTIRDLEYNADAGLAEPPQQVVRAQPPAWTPPAGADESPKPAIQDVWPSQGASTGGDRVTIRGRNLQPAQVLFGLTPARIVAASDAAVTVTAPAAGPGPVSIVVTNVDGNYAISAAPFLYYR